MLLIIQARKQKNIKNIVDEHWKLPFQTPSLYLLLRVKIEHLMTRLFRCSLSLIRSNSLFILHSHILKLFEQMLNRRSEFDRGQVRAISRKRWRNKS